MSPFIGETGFTERKEPGIENDGGIGESEEFWMEREVRKAYFLRLPHPEIEPLNWIAKMC